MEEKSAVALDAKTRALIKEGTKLLDEAPIHARNEKHETIKAGA